ncbi:MAG TPA: DNA-formamidopyrimidine glycosylase family protein [Solirubrobacteraceae bacterium]|nr:DNA-formamidopyrimidine glycosylase family protein [Solirubrobacteraceae bacterium]
MPEGDTIAYAANRMRPVLEGRVPDEIVTPQPRHALDRWPSRLEGRAIRSIDTHGKHLLLRFEGDLVLHSHLGMVGVWGVYGPGRRWGRSARRAWIVFRAGEHEVVEFDGPLLELITEGRTRFDQRLAALGPDVLADEFDFARCLAQLRSDDPTRPVGDALLDQRNVAGIGNIWKAEGCWEAGVDPWRPLGTVEDREVVAIIERVRPRMLQSAIEGPRAIRPRVYRLTGRPCPRCGGRIKSRGQGDANRTTYWCPGCQS